MSSSKPNKTWRNHYLPKATLAHFCNTKGKLVRTYLGPDGKIHEDEKVPKSAGFEEDLYSLVDAGPGFASKDTDQFEREIFHPIDTRGAAAWKKLLEGELTDLATDEKKALAHLINSLLERHPQRIRERDRGAVEMARETMNQLRASFGPPPGDRADVMGLIDIDGAARNLHREYVVRQVEDEKAVDALANFQYIKVHLGENPTLRFVTGDDAVVANLGKPWPITYFTLALDPSNLLVGHCFSEEPDTELLRDLALAHNFQLFRQCEYVFSRDPLQDNALFKTRTAASKFLRQIDWPSSKRSRRSGHREPNAN